MDQVLIAASRNVTSGSQGSSCHLQGQSHRDDDYHNTIKSDSFIAKLHSLTLSGSTSHLIITWAFV